MNFSARGFAWMICVAEAVVLSCGGSDFERFEYSKEEQRDLVASLVGMWANAERTSVAIVCEGSPEDLDSRRIAVRSDASSSIVVEVSTCEGQACGGAIPSCIFPSLAIPLTIEFAGDVYEAGLYRGLVDVGHPRSDSLTRSVQNFRVSNDPDSVNWLGGHFERNIGLLLFDGVSYPDPGGDGGTYVGGFERIGDASCP